MEGIATPAVALINARKTTAGPPPIPFDAGRLDALMDEAGIDALLVSSKHNIQYLLGGYRFFFFDHSMRSASAATCRSSSTSRAVRNSPPTSAIRWRVYERELGKFWDQRAEAARTSTDGIAGRTSSSRAWAESEAGRRRAGVPARRRNDALRKALPDGARRSAAAARTAARGQDAAGARRSAQGLRNGGRFDARGDRRRTVRA